MTFWNAAALVVSCLVVPPQGGVDACLGEHVLQRPAAAAAVAGAQTGAAPGLEPVFSRESVDVILTAEAALAWDEATGAILYEKNATQRRPVASLSKLASVLTVLETLSPAEPVAIPEAVRTVQRQGAHIRLPPGEHASVYDLLAAGLVASANDALITLAYAAAGDEAAFVARTNDFVRRHGFHDTQVSNATGLEGGEQFSTAHDIKGLFQLAYREQTLRNLLVSEDGVLRTREGSKRSYTSTNKLLGTYFPVLAAKTGYTPAAGQNLVVMTVGDNGERIGALVLGSTDRFQDMKALVEWIKRNYTWP
jgi:D-alanyl-D-alanine carboxypeptidase (penicillin-binding protein 5/6)